MVLNHKRPPATPMPLGNMREYAVRALINYEDARMLP